MNHLKLVGLVMVLVLISTAGAAVGMLIGAIIAPMKILDGRSRSSKQRLESILTDSNQDQI